MTIGEKIYKFRTSKNLTQKQFAEKIGVAQSAVNFWENGKRQPRLEQLKKITDTFNISMYFFLDDDLKEATEMSINSELDLINLKMLSIKNNKSLKDDEKAKQLKELITQLKLLQNHHSTNVNTSKKALLNNYYDELNEKGQNKAIEQIELLTKIPEYKK